ncbi:MAG: hypothetical protein CMJ48_06075 [Planctomycetaceae bacterium]|nr:hypothetical protein [Planctomycetaceae bacterium]
MRKFAIVGVLLAATTVQVGCIVPIWDRERNVRARQLINASESERHIPKIWERIWFLDAPDFQTLHRTHGGVL